MPCLLAKNQWLVTFLPVQLCYLCPEHFYIQALLVHFFDPLLNTANTPVNDYVL